MYIPYILIYIIKFRCQQCALVAKPTNSCATSKCETRNAVDTNAANETAQKLAETGKKR